LTYRNEAAFSKALVTAMRNKGIFVQRIESGETGKGIPDLFVITKRVPMWIELKRVHGTIPPTGVVTIPWRPGQQAWLNNVRNRGMWTATIACFDNGILYIPHDVLYPKNLVAVQTVRYYKDIRSLLA
jgi:hypothetical protein